MGFLNIFSKRPTKPRAVAPPAGTFTVDASGLVLSSTLPVSYPEELAREIGLSVIAAFRSALEAQRPLSEITVTYSGLKITARQMRGGAMVFLTPRPISPKSST
jgi:hypothetical protein